MGVEGARLLENEIQFSSYDVLLPKLSLPRGKRAACNEHLLLSDLYNKKTALTSDEFMTFIFVKTASSFLVSELFNS
jgi:hypothetical protein